MDHLFNLLKQLKSVKAHEDYVRSTRSHVVAFAKENPKHASSRVLFSSWRVLLRALESGSAIALTGVLLLLIVGGFSTLRKPVGILGLDPVGLRAEAEAIDIQIQLSELDYSEVAQGDEPKNESTVVGVVKKATRAIGVLKDDSQGESGADASATIDDVLDILGE